jgi:hypothetical protein
MGFAVVAPLGHNPLIPRVTRGQRRSGDLTEMPQSRRAGGPVRIRSAPRTRVVANRPPGNRDRTRPSGPFGIAAVAKPNLETARRIAESVIIAAVSSAGLYLVGTVYIDAYYGRLSIEVTSLDLAPTYVALQSVHALWGLLAYPLLLLLFYVLYRTFASPTRRLGAWLTEFGRRYPRLLLVLANLALVTPLLLDALATFRERELPHRSVLTEVNSVLGYAGLVLFGYVVWLGWSQRRFLVSEIRARKLAPIALVFLVYLLSALAATGIVAELAAEDLLIGASDASLRVEFVTKPGVLPELADKELILVTTRNGAYYVVEREPSPPSEHPTSYVVPLTAVEAARVGQFDAD